MPNSETFLLLDQLKIAKKDLTLLSAYKQNTPYDEDEMQTILQTLYGGLVAHANEQE